MGQIYDWAKEKYAPLGCCMYCGTTNNLTDEHILPFALSLDGEVVLPKSSCKDCAKITGAFEQKVLRGPLLEVRAIKKLKSRSKFESMRDEQNVEIIVNGKKEVLRNVPLKYRPVVLVYPIYEIPAHILKKKVGGINIKGIVAIDYGTKEYHFIKKMAKIDAEKEVRMNPKEQSYDYISFAKLLAKIAYGHSVAKGEVKPLERIPKIVDYILGKNKNIGEMVGTFTDPLKKEQGLLHKVATQPKDKMLLGYVKLFANSDSPEYSVIIDYDESQL